MPTVYDWSPVTNALNSQIDQWGQRNQVNNLIGQMTGGADPATMSPQMKMAVQAARTMPQVGLPLLLQLGTQQRKYGTAPQYDQQGRAFVLDDQGNPKYLDGISARPEMGVADGVAYDKHAIKPGEQIGIPKAPQTREVNVGDKVITEQWDGQKFVKVAEAPRYKPTTTINSGQKIPVGYRPKSDGTLEFIPGGPADPSKGGGRKAPTEDQAKNNQLYTRAKQQLPIVIDNFDALGQFGNQMGAMVPGTSGLTSTAYQRADGGLRDIAASYLYSVSGATANPGEVANLVMTVRPKVGDSEQTKADKKARIEQMVDSIRLRATPTAQNTQAPSAPNGPPAVGTVKDGYVFKGGDPSKQENWVKQ